MILMNPPGLDRGTDARHGAGTGAVVLVVDDEDLVRNLIVQVLRQEGCRVLEARNADEAGEICRRRGSEIDVLLTDEVMPGSSGSRLADLVVRALPRIRIIVMSGYIAAEHAAEHISDAGHRFLAKPFAVEELREAVREAMTKGEGR